MKQLLLELVNWIVPAPPTPRSSQSPLDEVVDDAITPRQFSPLPSLVPKAISSNSRELPSETTLEAISKDLLRDLGYHELAHRVIVRWNSRLQSTAGRAHYAESKVELNPRLLPFGQEEIDRTLRHELAHLLARFRAGRRKIAAHGKEWKKACADLGLADEKRTHNLPLPRREVQRKYAYRCPNCSLQIARVRPFRAKVACLPCCRKFGKGHYDDRFRLVRI